jgi:ATP-dependent RNA helicase RhlE
VEAVGDAFTLMSPEESKDVAAIERFLGRSIPRVLIPDFDYKRRSDGAGKSPPHGGRGAPHGSRREESGRGRGERSRSEPRPAAPQRGPDEPSHGRRPKRNAPDRRRRRM